MELLGIDGAESTNSKPSCFYFILSMTILARSLHLVSSLPLHPSLARLFTSLSPLAVLTTTAINPHPCLQYLVLFSFATTFSGYGARYIDGTDLNSLAYGLLSPSHGIGGIPSP